MSGSNPLVSVCIVTYNQEKFIGDCISSVLAQDVPFEFDVIVCDDASTDRTLEIVDRFKSREDGRLKIIRHSFNRGPRVAYLSAHNSALGRFVCHIDGDDVMYPHKLAEQVRVMLENECYVASWHRVDEIHLDGSVRSCRFDESVLFANGRVTLPDAIMFGLPTHSSIMYRRSVRQHCDDDRDVLDLALAWQLLEHGPGIVLHSKLGGYRVGTGIGTSRNGYVIRLVYRHLVEVSNKFAALEPMVFVGAIRFFLGSILVDRSVAPKFLLLSLKCLSVKGLLIALPRFIFRRVLASRFFK